jgi:response regulator RpfG family c-di-GMP phosphodiesterase
MGEGTGLGMAIAFKIIQTHKGQNGHYLFSLLRSGIYYNFAKSTSSIRTSLAAMFPEEKKIRVLYIDDEINNLLAFQSSYRRKYKIFIASSAAEGLNILNDERDIHVIICDQRMPHSTGVEFFQVVRKAFPQPVRILLTGYTDVEAIIDAINKGEIFRYIKKPWDELELQNAIQNAHELYMTRLQLKRKVSELEKTNDELNRFVYSTSHDLRSPACLYYGYTQSCQDGKLSGRP